MLSRVADSIYWMNRYIERAENIARVVDVNLTLNLDLPPDVEEQWEPLVLVTADVPLFREHYEGFTSGAVMEFLSFAEANPNSISSCLRHARENARSVREAISSEMWEQINRFYLFMSSGEGRALLDADPHELFRRIKHESHLFAGITDSTMSHGEGWHFGRLGTRLERADKTSRILDVKYFLLLPSAADVGSPIDTLQWSALLKSASAFEMYRKRFGRISPDRVAEFLLLDREFPRSILHCLSAAEQSLRAISQSPFGTFSNPAEQALGRLLSRLAYTRADEIIAGGLHEYLDGLQVDINRIGDAIHGTFFALRPAGARAATVPQ